MAAGDHLPPACWGAEGLARVAQASHANTRKLVAALTSIPGVTR